MATCLKDLLQMLIQPEKNWKTDLLYRWNDIVGSLHSKVRIEKIYDDMLILGVFHSCWMQELYLLSSLLITKINENLDQPRIKQIRFKLIGLKTIKKISPLSHKTKKEENIKLTKEDERIIAKIADPTLRDALKAFRIRCYQE
ncbi:MAG TPA: DUF721 domain-containing protein [Candidatus Babeliales bacterium]|nr:DUF721 domain-containing protein [Candidatus Babeliales bacterium]